MGVLPRSAWQAAGYHLAAGRSHVNDTLGIADFSYYGQPFRNIINLYKRIDDHNIAYIHSQKLTEICHCHWVNGLVKLP